MEAATLARPGRIEIMRAHVREPGADEVRVRIEGCGVCASNLGPWNGAPWFQYPFEAGALGHEAYGWIDALGDEVTGLAAGQRVAMLSSNGFAAYDVAPARAIVPLPAELDGQPFPGEPLGCAMNIFSRSGIRAGATVAILGVGFLGALLTQLAARAGARVIALSRREYALDVARSMGADETISLGNSSTAIDRVKALTGERLCEVVIEAAGKQEALDLASEITAERGRLVIAGYHQDGARQVNMQLWNWRGLDVINAHERDPEIYIQGIRAAVAAVCSGRLDPAPLYTHRLPLAELGTALELTRERPDGFMKALVVP
jgi:threonine dehydrogenase-like Zn-dependent dehydrogenase